MAKVCLVVFVFWMLLWVVSTVHAEHRNSKQAVHHWMSNDEEGCQKMVDFGNRSKQKNSFLQRQHQMFVKEMHFFLWRGLIFQWLIRKIQNIRSGLTATTARTHAILQPLGGRHQKQAKIQFLRLFLVWKRSDFTLFTVCLMCSHFQKVKNEKSEPTEKQPKSMCVSFAIGLFWFFFCRKSEPKQIVEGNF